MKELCSYDVNFLGRKFFFPLRTSLYSNFLIVGRESRYCKILKVLNLKFNLINKRHARIKLEYAFKLQTARKILPLTSFQMDLTLT